MCVWWVVVCGWCVWAHSFEEEVQEEWSSFGPFGVLFRQLETDWSSFQCHNKKLASFEERQRTQRNVPKCSLTLMDSLFSSSKVVHIVDDDEPVLKEHQNFPHIF
jgi:hypothetical protein